MWVPMLKKMFVFNFNFFSDNLSLNVFGGVLGFDVTTCIKHYWVGNSSDQKHSQSLRAGANNMHL